MKNYTTPGFGGIAEQLKAQLEAEAAEASGSELLCGGGFGVSVAEGKYTVEFSADGHLRALRYGQPWRDLTGDGMVMALVQEIQSLREQLADLTEGRRAILPKTEKHAKELLLVAEACLLNLSSPNFTTRHAGDGG